MSDMNNDELNKLLACHMSETGIFRDILSYRREEEARLTRSMASSWKLELSECYQTN